MRGKKKVLLTEDDQFTRFMMKEIFETLGYDADIVDNGHSCCDLVEANPEEYCLILMDIHMPEMSGLDATKRIRSNPDDPPKNIPIFAVTADEDYHDDRVVRDNGMDGFIKKPVTATELNFLMDSYC